MRALTFLMMATCLALVLAQGASVGTFKALWKFPTASPNIGGNYQLLLTRSGTLMVMYVTIGNTANTIEHIVGVNPSTGAHVWTYGGTGGNGALLPLPSTGNVVTFNTSHAQAIDPATGDLVWAAPVNFDAYAGAAEGVLVAGTDAGAVQSRRLGIDATTGKLLYNISSFSVSAMSVVGSSDAGLLFSFFQGGLALLNPRTGNFSQVQLPAGYVNTLTGSTLLVCTTPYGPGQATVSGTDVTTGKTLWTTPVPLAMGVCNVSSSFGVTQQAALSDDGTDLYLVTNSPPALLAMSTATGAMQWSTAITGALGIGPAPQGSYNSFGYPCVTEDYVAVFQLQPQSSGVANIIRLTAFSRKNGEVLASMYMENTLYPASLPVCDSSGVYVFATGPAPFHRPDTVFKFVIA